MATESFATRVGGARPSSISVTRLTVAGGITSAIVFVLCWLGTFIPFSSPTHAYIGLFTTAEMTSLWALFEGTLWSLLFGGIVGGLFSIVYNAAAWLERS